jgi:hypothetical protein
MSHWFAKSLGDALVAGESLSRIQERFQAEYERAGCPRDMAVFVRYESEGRLHCEVSAFFSPAAARVAGVVDATPCNQPVPAGLDLLAGAPESWRALFPDREA